MNDTTEVVNLPHFILTHITKFLSHNDLMSFRITCVSFYEATLCKDVACRLHVKPGHMQYISKELKEFVQKFHGGKYLKISFELLNASSLQNIIQSLENITDIAINIEHLDIVSEKCRHIKKLVLNVNKFSLYSFREECENSKDKFKSLSSLLELNEILLKGCRQMVSPYLLNFIITYATTITKISLCDLVIKNTWNSDLLRECIFTANHIRHWRFNHISMYNNLLIPTDSLSLECKDVVPILLNEMHTNLKKLIVEGDSIQFCCGNNFVNLMHLELTNPPHSYRRMIDCPKLQYLKFADCHKLEYFINLSGDIQTSLKLLSIQEGYSFGDNLVVKEKYYDGDILYILEMLSNLEDLELVNMKHITIDFLSKVHHSCLRKIILRNCFKCFNARMNANVDIIRSNVLFGIEIISKH